MSNLDNDGVGFNAYDELMIRRAAAEAEAAAMTAAARVTEKSYWGIGLDREVLGYDPCTTCVDHPCKGCPDNLTEDQKMAQAGASDEEIAMVNHVDSLKQTIANLRAARHAATEEVKDHNEGCEAGPCGDCTSCYDGAETIEQYDARRTQEEIAAGADPETGAFNKPEESLGAVLSRALNEADMCAICDNNASCAAGGLCIHTDEAAEFAQARRDAIDSLMGYANEPVDFGDFGAGTNANPTPPELRTEGLDAFFNGPGGEPEANPTKPVRDCDIPATLRAIEIPATEHGNAINQWFNDDEEMRQFLAGRRLYASSDNAGNFIKDDEGNIVGLWFYAHFGPTPVS